MGQKCNTLLFMVWWRIEKKNSKTYLKRKKAGSVILHNIIEQLLN